MIGKKGEGKSTSAGSVAVLVILIALFIIVYIMMLSPEDREELLFNQSSDSSNGEISSGGVSGKLILSESPGLVIPEEDKTVIHDDISPVDLYIKSEPVVSELSSLLTISKSLFSEKVESLSFKADNVDDVESASLLFAVDKAKGNLRVYLNGNKIFDSYIVGVGNVILPTHLLHDDNTLILKTSGIGLKIFGKNEYALTDVNVKMEYEITNTKESRNVILGAGETGNGKLDYFLYCREAPQGTRLKIYLNDETISNEVVSCISGGRSVDIDDDELKEGKENEIMFVIDDGDYFIKDIRLEVESETPGYVEYKFSLTEKEYREVIGERLDIILDMELSGDDERKATLVLNGYELDMDTDEEDYEKDITRFVEEGNNYIRIVPKREFVIDSLDIRLED